MCAMPASDSGRAPRCETARRLLAPRMPDRVPERTTGIGVQRPDLEFVKQLSPEARERLSELIRQRELTPWRPFYCSRPQCDGKPHENWTWNHARWNQHPPSFADDWRVWLMLGGRGGGKTRGGAEVFHRMAKRVPRLHLIAPTGPDIRETMVEGESGLLVTAPPDFVPKWEPSKKKLTWPNGSIALGFSGEEPDRLRGPQCYGAWIDEPAHMALIGGEYGVWDNLLFGLRLGKAINWKPRVIATTTPKPIKWMKELVKDSDTRMSRFSSYENLDNLADSYIKVLNKYEGTRIGRQELHAEVLEDVEGALWSMEWIIYHQDIDSLPDFDIIAVSVDPAGTANKRSDETGIIVLGVAGGVVYVLEDLTGKYSPSGWATAAVSAYHKWSADRIVAEKNYGGDMVKEVLEKNGAKDIKIVLVNSRRGKAIRAEPVATLYEKGKVSNKPRVMHCIGLSALEDELVSWVPGSGMASPNRLDALVHGVTNLAKVVAPAEWADPTKALKGLRAPELTHAG